MNLIFLLNIVLSFNFFVASESRIQKVDLALSQALNQDLYEIKNDGRFLKIEIDRSLDVSYKEKLHRWLHLSSKKDADFKKIYLTWKSDSFILSNMNQILIGISFLGLIFFLYLSLKLLSKKTNPLTIEEKISQLVEEKVEKTLLGPQLEKQIFNPPKHNIKTKVLKKKKAYVPTTPLPTQEVISRQIDYS